MVIYNSYVKLPEGTPNLLKPFCYQFYPWETKSFVIVEAHRVGAYLV